MRWLSPILLLFPVITHAQTGVTAQDLVVRFGGFLSNIILPLLFSLAALAFLYNMARYFIIGGDSDESRAKAKRNAIWGIAAFVFLISIWAIVNLVLGGLFSGFGVSGSGTNCPDYYQAMGMTCDSTTGSLVGTGSSGSVLVGSGSNTNTGSGSSGTSNTTSSGSNTTNGGSTTGGNNQSNSNQLGTGNGAALAELVFGTGKDAAMFSTDTFIPTNTTQTIPSNNSCSAGIDTLTLSSRADTIQSAYAFYSKNGHQTWLDITKNGSTNLVSYYINKLKSVTPDPGTPVYIIHTHPRSRYHAYGLTMTGQGPSVAAFAAACRFISEFPSTQLIFGIVSGNDVWKYQVSTATCPPTSSSTAQFASLETYVDLTSLESAQRSTILHDYLNSSLVPASNKAELSTIDQAALGDLSPNEVLTQAQPLENSLAIPTLQRFTSSAGFCNSL